MTTAPNFILAYVADAPKSAALYSKLLNAQPVESSPNWAMFAFPNRLALGLWALALCPFVMGRSRRRRRAIFGLASLFLLAMLFGFGDPQVGDASEQRLAAVDALLRDGTRDDRMALEQLSTEESGEVARRAQYALSILSARAPKARVEARSLLGSERLRNLMGNGEQLLVGRAKRMDTLNENGRFYTEYSVQSEGGATTTLRVAGGVRGGVGQRVMDAEAPPADMQEVAVVPQADGTQRWAYHQSGLLFGGHLGDGAAIAGAL